MSGARVGWGIIGSSGWAEHTFAPAIKAAENAELRAVLASGDDKAKAFQQKHQVAAGYSSLAKFLDDPNIEAVWIASPNYLHAEQAIAALRRGKHVLIEKPMAVTVADCQAIHGVATERGRLVGLGYHLRHHPLHQKIHAEWIAGAFGAPVSVRAQLHYAYPQPPAKWRREREHSGGWALGDIGTHLVDALRWFLGDAEKVSAELSNQRFHFETEDYAHLAIRFANGGVGVADASTGAGGPPPRLELYGTEGYCICEGTFFGGGGTVVRASNDGKARTENVEPVNLYQRQVEAFCRSALAGEKFAATGEDGLANVKILSEARGW